MTRPMHVLDQYVTDGPVNNVFPQVVGMGDDYRWNAPGSVRHVPMFAVPLIAPNLSAFHLEPTTTATDILSQAVMLAPGLLVSDRLRAELDNYAVHAHAWYDASVVHREKHLHYNWLHLTSTLESGINFAKSTFSMRDKVKAEQIVHFASETDLLRDVRELVNHQSGQLRVQTVTFVPGVASYDLFMLRLTDPTYFLSDRLATRMRDRGYTGFRILPSDAVFHGEGTTSP